MSMGITIDINGRVIERIIVQQTQRLEADPGGKRGYTIHEIDLHDEEKPRNRVFQNKVRHNRRDGALHLTAKVCEFLSQERRKR